MLGVLIGIQLVKTLLHIRVYQTKQWEGQQDGIAHSRPSEGLRANARVEVSVSDSKRVL